MSGKQYKIGTLGSHSALQILKGAHDEGFNNVVICLRGASQPYRSFKVADEIIEVDAFSDITKLEAKLSSDNVILVPHGSFFNAMSLETLDNLKVKYFGNKSILPWEENRTMQRDWLKQAGLDLPKIFPNPKDIQAPAIVKFFGAGGGKGFFLTSNEKDFKTKIAKHPNKRYIIQEYVIGAPLYIHYFYSPLTDELEIMSMDRRYETNVDSIGRIAAKDQLEIDIESSYNIMGNMPLVVRESMLPDLFKMGEKVVEASKKIEPRGLFGPFCLEAIITPELKCVVFEISARIVAGTNPYINGSPYTDLRYHEPMSTGRRIAREINLAVQQGKLNMVLSNDI